MAVQTGAVSAAEMLRLTGPCEGAAVFHGQLVTM